MLLDPTGEGAGLPLSLLDKLPISTFVLPGLWLLIVYGIGSLVIFFGLRRGLSWAKPAATILGLILIGWIIGQVILWGTPMYLQYLYFFVGVGIFVLGLIRWRQK